MANIKIPRKRFEKEIGKLDKAMQSKVALFGTTLESFDDKEIELEIFPNRPDLLSYSGFKRSFLAFLGKKTGLKKYKLNKPGKNYSVKIDGSVKNVRPYTACAIVKSLNLNDEKIKELIDIQEKLHITVGRKRKKLAIGIYPLEKIALPITFKALEPDKIRFRPLDSMRDMSGLEILQRHPAGKEYAHLLKGKAKFPIFVDANKQVLSMPPIINSELAGKVTEKTKEVFVECSGFDFDILKKCLNLIVTTLAEMGGEIYQMNLVGGKKEITPDLASEKMKISRENTNKLLGLNLTDTQIKSLLGKMGYGFSKNFIEIPAWRTDILHEVDLIEDVAIAYGYDKFVPEIPDISTIGRESKRESVKKKISEILVGLGLIEVSNYHLTNKMNQFTKMGVTKTQERDFVEVVNSKTEYNLLRKNLSHYLLKVFSENVDSEYPQNIFELGRVFQKGSEIREQERLSVASVPGNFTQVKQYFEYLARMIGIEPVMKEAENFPLYFIKGRVAEIFLGSKSIGFIGEIHPKILKNWKIKMPVALFEISLDEIFEKLN